MEKIEITNDILNESSPISYLNREGRKFITIDDEMAKIYTNLTDYPELEGLNRYRLQRKVELLQDLKDIKELVIPTRQVFLDGRFVGFTRPFYEQDKNLMEHDHNSNEEYVAHLKETSNILKKLHERKVLLGGVNFSNVLIHNNGLKFVNLEGVGIGIFEPDYYASRTYEYMIYNGLSNGIVFTKEFDKLSLFVEFMCYHFLASEFTNNWINGIRDSEYETFKNSINKDLKKYLDLSKKYFKIYNVIKRRNLPYLGDLIKDDVIEPNRTKRFSLRKKVMSASIRNGEFFE